MAKTGTSRTSRTGYATAGAALLVVAGGMFAVQQAGATTTTDQDGTQVTYADAEHVGTTDEGMKYAPRPGKEFRGKTCPSTVSAAPSLSANELEADSLPATVPVGHSSDLSALPDAPASVRYDPSAPLGSPHGKTVIAGHVDYSPGTRSAAGGELSPFGHLHKIRPCEHITATDEAGRPHTYAVTDLYTAPQSEIESTGIFTRSGDPGLALVTCSGPSVGDTGTTIGFAYRYNLVVEAAPVEVAA